MSIWTRIANNLSAIGDSVGAFLREVHKKACGRFSTVLGPAADSYHRDHIHLDIQARKSGNAFCH